METLDLKSKYIIASVDSGVLRLQLNRPERRNAMTMQMYNAVRRAAVIADEREDIRVLLITGAQDTFCVGGDMGGQSDEVPGSLAEQADPIDMIPFAHLEQCTKVVITAVNGLCHAGGLDMMMCSDIAIASERATFRAPELLRGIADGWLGARLPQRIGMAKAKWMIFTAVSIKAEEAERLGLVSLMVEHEKLMDIAMETAIAVTACAPAATASIKAQINKQMPAFDLTIFKASLKTEEVVEGFAAFVEKRNPIWQQGSSTE